MRRDEGCCFVCFLSRSTKGLLSICVYAGTCGRSHGDGSGKAECGINSVADNC